MIIHSDKFCKLYDRKKIDLRFHQPFTHDSFKNRTIKIIPKGHQIYLYWLSYQWNRTKHHLFNFNTREHTMGYLCNPCSTLHALGIPGT